MGAAVRDVPLQACRRTFAVRCEDDESADLIATGFGALCRPAASRASELAHLCAIRCAPNGGFLVAPSGCHRLTHVDADGLLFCVDKWLTLTLQRCRPELYFLHAAAVALRGCVAVLAGPAGAGKSTLTLALLQKGFDYLSDELAPVSVPMRVVWPYPHALRLKSLPPQPCRLPAATVRTGERFHLPMSASQAAGAPLPVAAVFFIRREPISTPICRPLTVGTAATHLTANALNSLAHRSSGLEVAMALASSVPCFELNSSDLKAACGAVETMLGIGFMPDLHPHKGSLMGEPAAQVDPDG